MKGIILKLWEIFPEIKHIYVIMKYSPSEKNIRK